MIVKGIIKKGEYYDSVTLMMAAKKLNEQPGVLDSAIVMGTAENKAILAASGLLLDEFQSCADADLIIVIKTADGANADTLLAEAETILKSSRKRDSADSTPQPRSLNAALQILPDANLALISVAGRYAGSVAMRALQRGLHVMLFSDNVPLEQEIALKQFAIEHGLLVMGPDCGTAIINGVPLAFANVVNRGDIGLVAAAGTGLQEVSTLISNSGAGISQAIGTGGRDVKKEVGGLMFLEGLRLLKEDSRTKIIVLISKPPHAEVLAKIVQQVKKIKKPVVAVLLGIETEIVRAGGMIPAASLAEAAQIAVALSQDKDPVGVAQLFAKHRTEIEPLAKGEARKLHRGQKYIRGLFSGGTFCYEAQLMLRDVLPDIYSNAPTGTSHKLKDSLKSERHTLLDLGEDEFTVGRPHPMIDYSLRNKRIITEAEDAETAVILLDIVLGYGSHPDPAGEIVPAIKKAKQIATDNKRHLPIICSVTGTDRDPQSRAAVAKALTDNGAIVMESNAAACWLAGSIVAGLPS
jgi:FdrA protein